MPTKIFIEKLMKKNPQITFPEVCEKVIKKFPKNGEIYLSRARYKIDNNYDKSDILIDFNKAIELKFFKAFFFKANYLYQIHEYKKAIFLYEESIQRNLYVQECYITISECFENLDDLKMALIKISKLIEVLPNIPNAYYKRSLLYKKLDLLKHSEQDALSGLAFKNLSEFEKLKFWNLLGNIYFLLKNVEKSIKYLDLVINSNLKRKENSKEHRTTLFAYISKGTVYQELLKDYDRAIIIYDLALKYGALDFGLDSIFLNKGVCLKKLDKLSEALECFKNVSSSSGINQIGKILIDELLRVKSPIYKEHRLSIINFIIDNGIFFSIDILTKFLDFCKSSNEVNYNEILKKIQLKTVKFLKIKSKKIDFGTLYMYSSDQTLFKNMIIKKIKCPQKKIVKSLCRKLIPDYTVKGLLSNTIYKKDPKKFNDPFDPYFKKYTTEFSSQFIDFRITCFTKIEDNLLMWSHYANNHRGICVGYEIEHNENIILDKVKYNGLSIESNANLDLKKSLTIKDIFFIKHENWRYENEYRMLHLDNSSFFYNKLKITEVIFGIDCSKNNRNNIIRLLAGKNIKFFQMSIGKNLTLDKNPIIL